MNLTAFLGSVVRILDESDISYMLTGSLAAAYHGAARATQDIDLVVELGAAEVEGLVGVLTDAGFYVSPEAALEAVRSGGQFNAIDPEGGWKADLIVRKDRAFSHQEFSRRSRGRLLGVEVWIATVEDLILAKLEWSHMGDSELQRRDVLLLAEKGWASLDRAYLERWVDALGLQAEWGEVARRLSTEETDGPDR